MSTLKDTINFILDKLHPQSFMPYPTVKLHYVVAEDQIDNFCDLSNILINIA